MANHPSILAMKTSWIVYVEISKNKKQAKTKQKIPGTIKVAGYKGDTQKVNFLLTFIWLLYASNE